MGIGGVCDLHPLVHAALNDGLNLDASVRNSSGLSPPTETRDFLSRTVAEKLSALENNLRKSF
jgi:hypothetical protein